VSRKSFITLATGSSALRALRQHPADQRHVQPAEADPGNVNSSHFRTRHMKAAPLTKIKLGWTGLPGLKYHTAVF
jgi:hypothetical protein